MARGRDLERARTAVRVLARSLVRHAIGDVIDAVGRVRQAVVGRQRIARRRDRGDRAIVGPVGEIILRNPEARARERVRAGQQGDGVWQHRMVAVGVGVHARVVDRAEDGSESAGALGRGDAVDRRPIWDRAGEVGGDADDSVGYPGSVRVVGKRIGRAAQQILVADRERLERRRGAIVDADGFLKVFLEGRLPDGRRVQAQEGRQQVDDVDICRVHVRRLRPRRRAGDYEKASR